MREELKGPKMEKVGVAVVQEMNEKDEPIYNVYLLNFRDDIIDEILISSRGYGSNTITGEKIQTSMLRHKVDLLMPNEFAKIEPIMEDVFGLVNEYWVSFWEHDKMYDKKFIFLPETIAVENMKSIPLINKPGVLIMS